MAVAVEGFGLFEFDTAAFEPSLCLDWLFSTYAHCFFVSASPRKAFLLPTEEKTHTEGRTLDSFYADLIHQSQSSLKSRGRCNLGG